MILSRSLVLLLLFVMAAHCMAQSLPPDQYTSTNKKAIKYLKEGKVAFEMKKDADAEKFFKKAIEEDDKFVEAALGLGNLYQVTGRHQEAVTYFKKAIGINPKFFPNVFYFLSQSLMENGQYQEAKNNLETFLKFERINPNTKESAQHLLTNANFGTEALKNPTPYNPINAGSGINSNFDEYFPAVTGDGKQLLFTRSLQSSDMPGYQNEDFFMSTKQNGIWSAGKPIREVNSAGNEGAPSLSSDGNIMFFASCADEFGNYGAADRKGYGSCDIFYAQKVNGEWTRPRNAGPAVNSNHWETQPSFSSDGKTLYFIRGIRTRGGVRDQDIYMSTISDEGTFSPAVKISSVVNTPMKEESVFIHPDNQTLYFSSDGHPGMGGLDIYMSKRLPSGEWGTPVNLGYPINSFSDENSLLVDPEGKLAFFATNSRKDGFGGLDIYSFELPANVRPEKITYIKGKVYNARTKEPLEANFELLDLEQQKVTMKSTTGRNGEFFTIMTTNKNYLVSVNKEGFLFYSDHFSLIEKAADFNKPYEIEIPLEPIDTGRVVELKGIFFDVNKFDIKPESKAELDKLVAFLTKNKTLKIELSGHTDNTGDKKANLILSANRAKAVADYLVTTGKIAPARLTSRGYGDTKPKVPNDSAENKALNRRTEFKVIGK